MTESDWLSSDRVLPMLEYMEGKVSNRKLQLFSIACVRRIWHLIPDALSRRLVEATEGFLDGKVAKKEASRAYREFERAYYEIHVPDHAGGNTHDATTSVAQRGVWAAITCSNESAQSVGYAAAMAAHGPDGQSDARTRSWEEAQHAEQSAQADLLRDIFGNPFRPLPPRPEAIAPLAEQIYAGAWDRMPLLGEWLQEHGYPTEAEHCLDPNIHHVKGCWVVDWVTGRE